MPAAPGSVPGPPAVGPPRGFPSPEGYSSLSGAGLRALVCRPGELGRRSPRPRPTLWPGAPLPWLEAPWSQCTGGLRLGHRWWQSGCRWARPSRAGGAPVAQHSSRPAKRKAAHSKTPGPRPGYRAADQAGPNAGADWSYFGSDHPSWPAGSAGPGWPQPGTDYRSWPATAAHPGWSGHGDQPGWSEGAIDPRAPAAPPDPPWSSPAPD